jgi:hypothetical protein
MSRLVRLIWASPATLIGLLFVPFFSRRHVQHGVLLCEGASWPGRLGWRYRAITFGHVVLCVDRIDEPTLAHELVHASQYERWGILLWPAYLVAALWAVASGRHFYRDNYFEVQARTRATR